MAIPSDVSTANIDSETDDPRLWRADGLQHMQSFNTLLAFLRERTTETIHVLDEGATGDGTTDDRTALATADTEAGGTKGILIPPGTYLVNSNLTLASALLFLPGATIKPASGVTVTLARVPDAGFDEIFDLSAGGSVAISATGTLKVDWWGGKTSAALAGCVAGATAGSLVLFEPSTYAWASSVTITKRLELQGQRAHIQASSILASAIAFNTVDRPRVEGFRYEGAEDITSFRADVPASAADVYCFVKFDTCTRPRAFDIDAEGTRCAVLFDTCTQPRADRIEVEGFLPDTSGGSESGGNYCPAVFVQGGSDYKITDVHADHHGSSLLVGTEANRGVAFGISGRELHDNGVYLSSAKTSVAALNMFSEVVGTGVKARGQKNLVALNNVSAVDIGISLTGNGATPDAEGANGYANAAIGNLVSNYSSDGLLYNPQDGLLQRDLLSALNIITDGANTGGFAATRCTIVKGLVAIGNMSVNDGGTSYAFIYGGTVSDSAAEMAIIGHLTRDPGGDEAMRVQFATNPIVAGNLLPGATTYGIECRTTDGLLLVANSAPGKGIHAHSGDSNTNQVVGANKAGSYNVTGGTEFDNN